MIPYSDSTGRGRKLKGPEFDPVFQKYENNAAQFLTKYSNGIFLKDYYSDKLIPSIRILSTPSVDFSNLKGWGETHWQFLGYLRMNRYYTQYQASIISYQTERIFQKSNVPKGITI
jgi:hypothetical protein